MFRYVICMKKQVVCESNICKSQRPKKGIPEHLIDDDISSAIMGSLRSAGHGSNLWMPFSRTKMWGLENVSQLVQKINGFFSEKNECQLGML